MALKTSKTGRIATLIGHGMVDGRKTDIWRRMETVEKGSISKGEKQKSRTTTWQTFSEGEKEYVEGSVKTKTHAYTSAGQANHGMDKILNEMQSAGISSKDIKELKEEFYKLSDKEKEQFWEEYRKSYTEGEYSSSAMSERQILKRKVGGSKGRDKYISYTVREQMGVEQMYDTVKNILSEI